MAGLAGAGHSLHMLHMAAAVQRFADVAAILPPMWHKHCQSRRGKSQLQYPFVVKYYRYYRLISLLSHKSTLQRSIDRNNAAIECKLIHIELCLDDSIEKVVNTMRLIRFMAFLTSVNIVELYPLLFTYFMQ